MTPFRDSFEGPWRVVEIPAPGYSVQDAVGNELVFIYANPVPDSSNRRFRMSMSQTKALAEQIAALGRIVP